MSLRTLRTAVESWTPGLGIAADPLHRIAAAWPALVGANVAAHSQPLELNGTTLLVATRSSAWSQQLQMLSPAILEAVTALPQGAEVRRLAFRSGGLRRPSRRPAMPRIAAGVRAPFATSTAAELPPAADAAEALERLRRRFATRRAAAPAICSRCGGPLAEALANGRCAPCDGAAERERALHVERTIYLAPWLTHAEMREHLPDLSGAEFERARRRLLQRWWLTLERVKRLGSAASCEERQVASSYVLLQSRLPPDRITPAIARNLLGDEVANAIWPATTGASGAVVE